MGIYETSRTLLERLGLGKAREMTTTMTEQGIMMERSHQSFLDRMFHRHQPPIDISYRSDPFRVSPGAIEMMDSAAKQAWGETRQQLLEQGHADLVERYF